jgi:hypothetical protein
MFRGTVDCADISVGWSREINGPGRGKQDVFPARLRGVSHPLVSRHTALPTAVRGVSWMLALEARFEGQPGYLSCSYDFGTLLLTLALGSTANLPKRQGLVFCD